MAKESPSSITALLQKANLDDHEEILRACTGALTISKFDETAKHAKVVALLNLDRYEEAIQLFEGSGKDLQAKAPLEYAYSLYKGGRPKEAVQVTAALPQQRGSKHLEAQALYRTEEFSKALAIYESLYSEHKSSESSDLRINRGASEAQLLWSHPSSSTSARKPGRADLEAFEFAYNAACSSIARGDLRQAEVLLKRAKELCKHSDDISAEEKAAELLPIVVQQLYVLERLGKNEDAQAIATELSVEEISDIATREIAQHNLHLALPQPSNPFLTHKSLGNSPTYSSSDQPFQVQQRSLYWNRSVVNLQASKYDGVARSTTKLFKSRSDPSPSSEFVSSGVLNAAACAKGEDSKLALKHLLAERERNPFNLGLALTIVQLCISMRNPTSAINVLESLFSQIEQSSFETRQDLRFNPGLIALAVALYGSQGRKTRVAQELERAASHWRRTPNPPTSMLQSAGCALLESSNANHISSAGEIFKSLHENNPTDQINIAGYVAAYAIKDPGMVEAHIRKLTPLQQLIQGVDVDSLENAGIPPSSSKNNALAIAQKNAATATTSSRKRGAAAAAADQGPSKKRKKIRKSRLPKDYDPNKTPDPERWLPLRDRSTYRPKGKKGRKRDLGGGDRTQGGIVTSEVSVNEKDGGGSVPTTPGVIGGGGGGGRKQNQKKKKGKK